METQSKYLKLNLVLEAILGTVPFQLKSCTYKIISSLYASVVLVVSCIYFVRNIFTFFECNESRHIACIVFIGRNLRAIFTIYFLFKGLVNDEKKTRSLLDLDAMESLLLSLDIKVPGIILERIIAYVSLSTTLLHFVAWANITFGTIIITDYLFEAMLPFYCSAMQCYQIFTCTMFLTRCFRIQKAVANEINYIQPQTIEERLQTESGPFVIQRRVAWAEGSEIQRRNFTYLKQIQSAFNKIQLDVHSCCCMIIIWMALMASVMSPIITLTFYRYQKFQSFFIGLGMLSPWVTIIVIILIQTMHQKEKEACGDSLSALWATNREEEARRNVRHVLLRHLHSTKTYSCYLFDADFPLLGTIVETLMLIVTTSLQQSNY